MFILIDKDGCYQGHSEYYLANADCTTIQSSLPDTVECCRWIDNQWVLDKAKQQHDFNIKASSAREQSYATQIDPLHARKQRKLITGTWTEEDETAYVAEVKLLSEQIELDNPYMEIDNG